MDIDKPSSNDNVESDLTISSNNDWIKKLEEASGEQVSLTGMPRQLGMEPDSGQRTLQFRCAVTGQISNVIFARHSPSHSFQIVSVLKAKTNPLNAFQKYVSQHREHLEKSFDASEFDWAGWFCPHCGYKETFIKCSECSELVCGGRIRNLPGGASLFACHDGCGHTGEIKGHIKSYRGTQGTNSMKSTRVFLSSGHKKELPPSG